MLRHWSIKNLLQLSATITVVVAVFMMLLANYGQSFVRSTQEVIEQKFRPIEQSSRALNSVALSMATRLKSIMASASVTALETKHDRGDRKSVV